MRSPIPTGPAWLIRALPVVGAAVGAVDHGWLGLVVGLVVGWLVALVVAWVLTMVLLLLRRAAPAAPPDLQPEPLPGRLPDPSPDPRPGPQPDLPPAPPGAGPAAPAPRPPLDRPRTLLRDTDAEGPSEVALLQDVTVAEPDARRRAGGFLSGRYVLVGGELLPLAMRGADVLWLREDDGDDAGPDWRQTPDGTWMRPVPVWEARCVVTYEATARHVGGAVLTLLSRAPAGTVRARWERGPNADAARTIPAGFRWEKNDDHHDGEVPDGDLSDVRDRRVGVRLWPL